MMTMLPGPSQKTNADAGRRTAIETVAGGGGDGLELEAEGERGLGGVRGADGPDAGPLTPGVLVGGMPGIRI